MPTPRRHANQAARQAAYRERLRVARRKELEAKGLPALPAVASLPGTARWQALLQQAERLLQTVHEEMQEYYDQRTEAWQTSERGEVFVDRLQAVQELQSATAELVL